MAYHSMSPLVRRWLAGVLAAQLGLGPLATPAYAALTPLADEPLAVKNSAKPNIVLTVDDSTSMLFDFLPDYVVSAYCRGGTGAMTAACGNVGAANDFTLVGGGKYFSPGYTYQQYTYPYSKFTGAGTYDAAGPGAGCYPGSPPTCSQAIDPGALPGLAIYPPGPQPSWPNAGKPYEYWLMWPAPAHSAGLNAIYYDPRLTYEPPVDSTGASYPQMNAGSTSNWTQVPADPWASTITNVDLTAAVTDGLWCNSDWSLGSAADPTQCRYNGTGGAAFGTVSAAEGQDYTYPWAPPGFNVSASAGATTASTYAAQKVALNGTLTGTAINATNWNATSQNQKYFYENENIIWCDPTSPAWPQTGPQIAQTCGNFQAQTCSAFAGLCANPVNGACNNAPSCNGLTTGTCSGYLPPLCTGSAGTCNGYVAPACTGAACVGSSAQTCNGTAQTCPTSAQTCSGPFNQTCVPSGTQTCQPQVCSVTYNPPGCNLLPPDPENPCTPVTTCAPPVCTPDPGRCSIQTTKSCTQNSDCTPQPGACSVSGASCMQQSNCPAIGQCSIVRNLCTSVADCTIVGGTCSKTNQACAKSSDCPAAGNCQLGGAACLVNADCPGTCNNPPNAQCQTALTCPAKNGLCSNGVTVCQSATQCPLTGGLCQTRVCAGGANAGQACTNNGGCPGSSCNPAAACTLSNQCPATNGKCTGAGALNNNACQTNAQCLTPGTCSNNGAACATVQQCPSGLCTDNTTRCYANQDCPKVGTCNTNGASCVNNNQCPSTAGVCSISNAACTTAGVDAVNCPALGKCGPVTGPFTGAQCTKATSCPSLPGPLPPNAAVCSTGGVGGVATATLRNDADTASKGVVCRHNNMTYTGTNPITAGPFNYPSGKYLTPITNGTGVDACPSTDRYASRPRHYWKSEVEWCDKKIATAGDKWLGYGTDAGGTCQPGKDATHIYPRFYQFGAATYVNNYSTSAFQRVDLDIAKRLTATYTHTWINALGQTKTITRNFDEEMTNYANWFAYYRTRIQAVKTVTSLAFTNLDDQYRVGFHTLSNGLTTSTAQSDPATFVNIADFDAAQKTAWFQQLFAITIPLRLETPTLDAMSRIGEYFRTGSSVALAGATDPIIISCQKNWHMLFTDGFTNQAGLPSSTVANQDDTVPTLPQPVTGLTAGQPWPPPFREDPIAGASNAASDYSMKYWVTDLRTSGANATDDVPTTSKDPASWQHLNFAAMSLGTQGKLPVANQSLTENLLASGALKWPQPYPTVNRPDNSGVDDLWHAATNGRGRFVNAQSADELKLGMGQILQDITNQAGSRAGVGLASSSISLSNHAVYRVTFQPGWAGTVTKIDVDPVTGAEISNLWEAAEQLHNQLTILPPPDDKPWFTKRKIFTTDDSNTAVPFLWANLSAAQQDSLAPGLPAVGAAVVEYLRGNPTNEGVALGQFRVRATASFGENFLGDIVDSQAVFVRPPSALYLDANDPGYSAFAASMSGRPKMVYAGGNDGMLHAFKDTNGDEAWAYIPHELYRPDNTGLGALAYQDGALPPFRHHYYVDSTPRIVDVDFGGQDWRSILVGGLGKGGKSYYALDVTQPASIIDETTAAAQYLWTFTDADMGYSYGRPMLVKTRAFGNAWLMVVAAGYNNPSGVGKVFFVDVKTGTKVKTMTTGFGTTTSPSGLAHIAGYIQDFRNLLIDQIYGGDLYGNFWRFDVSDPNPANWTVQKMAYLTDPGGNPQPVTTPPQIEVDIGNGVDRWVFIGTGRLLDDTDITNTTIANQQQTFYAIRDGTTTTPLPIVAALQPRTDFVALTDKLNGLSAKPAKGWYDDLPAGQRIITQVQAALSVVAYAGTAPQDNPCLTGLPATLYARQFDLGNSLLLDSSGQPTDHLDMAEGVVGLDVVIFSDSSGGVDIRVGTSSSTTGAWTTHHTTPPSSLAAHRMSWRLLGQ
ncbi:MAG TPA: PilC/PilY family type IV pilus protein [Casimicrobiaceae bacterium]|nr:PilC/PilY family type IV pilus protein [Casimicrobiaceae bacterium]